MAEQAQKDRFLVASTGLGGSAGNVGYEVELWRMADALRGSMDAAERAM